MYGDESNPKSSAERERSQRSSTNDPHQSESERYESRGSTYGSNTWNTDIGAGQYGTDRSTGDINIEQTMQGAMPVPRMVSEESMTEARVSRRASEEGVQGAGRTSDMGSQSTGRGFWDRLIGSREQREVSQQTSRGQPEADMGSGQCYVDESGGIVDLDPACGLYGRHEYGAQMGYGHEVYERGEYRVEGQPWSRGAGSEAWRRFDQATPQDTAQPSFGQQQYQPSYGSEETGQYAGTGPEQFGWRRPEEAQSFRQDQKTSDLYQTAPSYGRYAGAQGELTDYGREIAIGGMPLFFAEMRASETRRMALDEAMRQNRGMGQQEQYQPSGQPYNQPGMKFAGPERFRQRSTEEIWGFQEGQRPSEQYQAAQAPSYGQMEPARMQDEMTGYGREIAAGGMPLYFQEMRESETRHRSMEPRRQEQYQPQQYQRSYETGSQYQQYGMGGQEMNAPEYGRSGEFGHEGWTGRYGEYGVGGAGAGMRSMYEEHPLQQRQESYTEQDTGAIPERYGQMGSRQMHGELTPVGWEIAMGGMPLYFQEMKSAGWRQRALEDRQMGMGQQQYQPSYQGSQSLQTRPEQSPQYGQSYQGRQTGPSYAVGQQAQGPYSQSVSQLPYSQPDMSFTGETYGPAAFSRGSYFGRMGLQQYGEPVQHDKIPEPASIWKGESRDEAGMGGQYQHEYQREMESQHQQPDFESESFRGKAQYGMGRDQFSYREGEPCMIGGGPYSCSQFVTERYGGQSSPQQPGSRTEPLSTMASSEMTPYGQERTLQGAMPLYRGQEAGMYRQAGSDQFRTGSNIYPSGTGGGAMGRYSQGVSEYPGVAPTEGAIGQMYGPTQGDTENLSQAGRRYYGQGNPYSQEPQDVTSPYGTKPGSVGREGEQMGQTACLMAYETGPYTGQSSYNVQQRGSLADFRKDQCGL